MTAALDLDEYLETRYVGIADPYAN